MQHKGCPTGQMRSGFSIAGLTGRPQWGCPRNLLSQATRRGPSSEGDLNILGEETDTILLTVLLSASNTEWQKLWVAIVRKTSKFEPIFSFTLLWIGLFGIVCRQRAETECRSVVPHIARILSDNISSTEWDIQTKLTEVCDRRDKLGRVRFKLRWITPSKITQIDTY
jgi:hypothetical protein